MALPKLNIDIPNIVLKRMAAIDHYVLTQGINSYDPYDGLSSPLAKYVLFNNQLLFRIWQQAVRLFPFNLRPILGIKKIAHTKAISDLASGFALLYLQGNNAEDRKKLLQYLGLLERLKLITPNGYGWGLRFPFATRFITADSGQPNIFQTINAVHSFLDGCQALEERELLETALKGFSYLENDLGYIEEKDAIRWRYWQGMETPILNVNGLMIGLTARLWKITGRKKYLQYCQKLYRFISRHQNGDGSWYYAANEKGRFIDGFHTGYILEGLCRAIESGTVEKDETLDKGVRFYLSNFFTADHLPKYYPDSVYPIDAQNAAQAIQTMVYLSRIKMVEPEAIQKCFASVDKALWNSQGYFNYWKTRQWTYKTPMHRWATGPMFLALVYLKNEHSQ
ncbi:MAG: hypothetical protein RDU76_11085 [Candidatus Edwardsbacteria bacterium]|nr:hypothetical protein [Candidatus Edwardsbacteria bacterium]